MENRLAPLVREPALEVGQRREIEQLLRQPLERIDGQRAHPPGYVGGDGSKPSSGVDLTDHPWTAAQRAVIFSAALTIDFDYFEENSGRQRSN